MIPADDLDRLRELWDHVPPPSDEQRLRARARLLAAIASAAAERQVVAPDPGAGPAVATIARQRPTPRPVPWRRRVGAIAVAGALLAVIGTSWWAVRELRTGPLPAIDEGREAIPIPTDPVPLQPVERHVITENAPPADGLTTTVFVPDAPGPWPIVVLLRAWSDDGLAQTAHAIAERGAVVHLPEIALQADSSLTADLLRQMTADAVCAVQYARATAAAHGALADRLVIAGHGLGGWYGALVALMEPEDLPRTGCTTEGGSVVPAGFVGFAGDYGCWLFAGGCPDAETRAAGLVPGDHVANHPQVPFHLLAPSHSMLGSPQMEQDFGEMLREAGHPVDVEVLDRASPGDFSIPGTAANQTTIERILEVARG